MIDFCRCSFIWQGELITTSLEELNKMAPEIKKMKMIDAILACRFPKFIIKDWFNKDNKTDCCPPDWTNIDEYLYEAPVGIQRDEASQILRDLGMDDILQSYRDASREDN